MRERVRERLVKESERVRKTKRDVAGRKRERKRGGGEGNDVSDDVAVPMMKRMREAEWQTNMPISRNKMLEQCMIHAG